MRFSIASIILLTFWTALGLQTYLLHERSLQAVAERQKSQVESQRLQSEIASWKQQQVDRHSLMLRSELQRLDSLDQELAKAFAAAAPALSSLNPADKLVSVRNIPILGRYRYLHHKVKLSVPPSREVALEIDVRKRPSDGVPRQPAGSALELKGEYPISIELMTGIHIVECLFDYRDDVAEPFFSTLLDGNEIGRITCPKSTGYGSSHPTWFKQQDFRADSELPYLLELSPGSQDAEIVVRLVDVQ